VYLTALDLCYIKLYVLVFITSALHQRGGRRVSACGFRITFSFSSPLQNRGFLDIC